MEGSKTLLIVEDDPLVRKLTCKILRSHGHIVIEATNGREALAIVSRHTGDIDLVLTDVVMPELGGKTLVAELLASRPHIKVLYVSGYPPDRLIDDGVLAAEDPFIQKPFTAEVLKVRVREALESASSL